MDVGPIQNDNEAATTKNRTAIVRRILRLVIIVIITKLVLYGSKLFIQPYWISSPEMEPALRKGDRVVVRRWHNAVGNELKRGQIIAFETANKSPCISRLIGLAGDHVDTKTGKIASAGSNEIVIIPSGEVFVASDDCPHKNGSSMIRFVDKTNIIGPVWLRYWPDWHVFSD